MLEFFTHIIKIFIGTDQKLSGASFFIDLIDAASDVPTDAGPDADGGLDGAVDASDATPDGGDAALTDVGDDGARDVAPDASVGGGGGCTSVTERPIGSAGWLSLFALLVLRIRRRVSAVHVLFHTC